MDEEIFDVILQSTGRFQSDVYTYQEHRPPEEDLHLGREFWVGDLPRGISSELVFNACGPAGLNFRPSRLYGMRYAFCRRVRPDHSAYYQWDSDISLGITIFLSRLIRPTTIGTSLAARLYFANSELKSIVPGPTQGLGAQAWVIAKNDWRDWLSVPELEQLRDLLPVYQTDAPDRVRRARKHIDRAFHAYYLDQRFASLITSFESLLKTSRDNVTAQFKTRTSRLAEMLGYELSAEDLKAMYSDRSDFVHGSPASFSELSDELRERYTRFEVVLRLALLRASTERAFAQLFSSAEAVEKAFGS
jgi:hypothetical protein